MEKLSLRVSEERWQQAQEWERAVWQAQNVEYASTWITHPKAALRKLLRRPTADQGDDWNFWWREQFNGYRAIPNELSNAIELGCGPYTNVRLIRQGRNISHLYCSDPLIKQYITFRYRWLAEAWQRAEVLIDDHPLEACPFASDYFDLVVLINVLDHVRDGLLCLDQAIRITKPGGYLVIGQDLSTQEDSVKLGEDIGHPIRIDQVVLDAKVMPRFEPVFYKILSREEGRNPAAHYGTYLYLGRRLQ